MLKMLKNDDDPVMSLAILILVAMLALMGIGSVLVFIILALGTTC